MEEEDFVKAKRATGEGLGRGWSPGVGQLLVLALSLILLVGGIVAGLVGGIIFTVPLVVLALMIPLITLRGGFGGSKAGRRSCPHCGARLDVAEHIVELDCPRCKRHVEF